METWPGHRLTAFIAGFPGPPEPVPFLDVSIRLISTSIYAEGVRVEFLVHPLPEASSEVVDDPHLEAASLPADLKATIRRYSQIWPVLDGPVNAASLSDDIGTEYVFTRTAGWEIASKDGLLGYMTFTPGSPAAAQVLTFQIGGARIEVPLSGR